MAKVPALHSLPAAFFCNILIRAATSPTSSRWRGRRLQWTTAKGPHPRPTPHAPTESTSTRNLQPSSSSPRFAAASGFVAPGIFDSAVVFPNTPNAGGQPGYLRYISATPHIKTDFVFELTPEQQVQPEQRQAHAPARPALLHQQKYFRLAGRRVALAHLGAEGVL